MSTHEIIYFIILIIVLTIGMVRYKKLTIPFRILTLSVLVAFFWEVLSEVFAIRYGTNALISHFQGVSGYIFYAFIFSYFFKSNALKKIVLISIIFVVLFSIINALFIQPYDSVFPSYVYLITNSLCVLFSLLIFKQMLQYPLNVNIIKQSIFWFNTAILLFSATMFLNMGFTNYYIKHKWGTDIIFYLWFCSDCLLNILICVSLLTDNKESSIQYG